MYTPGVRDVTYTLMLQTPAVDPTCLGMVPLVNVIVVDVYVTVPSHCDDSGAVSTIKFVGRLSVMDTFVRSVYMSLFLILIVNRLD